MQRLTVVGNKVGRQQQTEWQCRLRCAQAARTEEVATRGLLRQQPNHRFPEKSRPNMLQLKLPVRFSPTLTDAETTEGHLQRLQGVFQPRRCPSCDNTLHPCSP